MRTNVRIATLALTLGIATVAVPAYAGLERLLPDLYRCKTNDFYLDGPNYEPQNDYLRKLTPYKIKDGFAYYRVKETYYGLPVTEFMIPASTSGILSLTLDMPLPKARAALKTKLGSEFRSMVDHDAGKAPVLIADRTNKSRSVLVCTTPE